MTSPQRRRRAIAHHGPGRPRGHCRVFVFDGLRMPRVWMHGRRWKRHFGVRAVPLVDVAPGAAPYHRVGKTLLVYTFEEDIRELVLLGRELRPGVYAQWWDPRELFV
jgi:hypothetical protein